MEHTIRTAIYKAALDNNNEVYANGIDAPGALSLTTQGKALAVVVDMAYNWQRYEQGLESIDLKERLLNGLKSRSILPKISKHGQIQDPGGRWNVVPFDGGGHFRTVSTPRFDGHGRLKGSDPSSWIMQKRTTHYIMDEVLLALAPELQIMVDLAEILL